MSTSPTRTLPGSAAPQEHKRPFARLLPQKHRPGHLPARRPSKKPNANSTPDPTNDSTENPRQTHRTITPQRRRCTHHLKPPFTDVAVGVGPPLGLEEANRSV
uniref:Uncharacterized protein n=1 Tax=Siphoviridae sp. ctJyX12 TaxID=2827840 RepID=A0A8S5SPR0_9CAUD|nr:MAG TPA: hypothetical protein [Siphoviridae sp. ctJyX12]